MLASSTDNTAHLHATGLLSGIYLYHSQRSTATYLESTFPRRFTRSDAEEVSNSAALYTLKARDEQENNKPISGVLQYH